MYHLEQINDELQAFEVKLERTGLSVPQQLNYIAIYRHLLEADQMSEEDLIKRAKRIKPLIRLDVNGNRRNCGDFEPEDKLVFVKPTDIHQSYLYNFNEESIITEETQLGEIFPLEVGNIDELTRFTCYHRYGGYYGFFRPGADEVLSQIPPSVNWQHVAAFEIKVDSLNLPDMYDGILDRHVTTVILYKMKYGLPSGIYHQKVICNGNEY